MHEKIKRLIPSGVALERKLRGYMSVNPGKYGIIDNGYYHTLLVNDPEPDRVRIVFSGGGALGLMFLFFTGAGLADAACEGDYDSAPNAFALYEAAKRLGCGKGVLFITNNFAGDFLNNDMAVELLRQEGIDAIAYYVCDDIFSAAGRGREERGGLIGGCVLTKVAAKASESKLSLDDVYAITETAGKRLSSGSAVIDWESGSCKLGVGFSGEDPAYVLPFENWEGILNALLERLLDDLSPSDDETLYLTLSRMSRTSNMECYGMMYTADCLLEDMGYRVGGRICGQYFEGFDESGVIINLFACSDSMKKYYRYVKMHDFVI